MKHNWKIYIGLAIVSAVVVGAYLLFFVSGDQSEYITEKVQKGSIKKTVSVTGSVSSQKPVGLNFESSGRIEEIKVKAGDEVAAGEVVAVLDNEILRKQLNKAKAVLEKSLADSRKKDDNIREAEEKVDNAEDYLEAVKDHQDELVDSIEMDYENAKEYYEDVLSYYNQVVEESGEESSLVKNAKMSLTKAKNGKEKAEQALKTAKKSRDLKALSAENSLDITEEALESAESNYVQKSGDALVESARADYEIAKKRLGDTSLKSPVNGVISEINYEEGEVLGSSGLGSHFGEVITKDFVIESEVPESDISQVDLGQKAEIIFDAFSDNVGAQAKVIDIDPASTIVQGVVYYKATLKLETENPKIKEGMTVDAEILIDGKSGVLKIPKRAVREKEKESFVEVVGEEGTTSERKIIIGLNGDEGYVEIEKGLKKGEEVVLSERN